LRMPFAAVAVDLNTASQVVLTEGLVYLAVRASASIPGVFPPLRSGDQCLVDGGVLNPLPTDTVAALGADVVIGVDVSNPIPLSGWPGEDAKAAKDGQTAAPHHVVGILRRVVDVMQTDISQKGTEKAAVLIRPRFGPSGPYDFHRQEQFAAAGEEAAREALPQLRTILPWLGG
jgi:NTE family protein